MESLELDSGKLHLDLSNINLENENIRLRYQGARASVLEEENSLLRISADRVA